MTILAVASPALKMLFERVGRPEVTDLPDLLKPGGPGAVIACNHVGWADGLWLSYAVYPRQLRHMSKMELFGSSVGKWIMEHSGSIAIDRNDPAPSSIKTAIDALRAGEIVLVFPSGTRNSDVTTFKRGAATIALHAQVPIVPAFYQGPRQMQMSHLMGRPRIQIAFGPAITTKGVPIERGTANALTHRLHAAIDRLGSAVHIEASAA